MLFPLQFAVPDVLNEPFYVRALSHVTTARLRCLDGTLTEVAHPPPPQAKRARQSKPRIPARFGTNFLHPSCEALANEITKRGFFCFASHSCNLFLHPLPFCLSLPLPLSLALPIHLSRAPERGTLDKFVFCHCCPSVSSPSPCFRRRNHVTKFRCSFFLPSSLLVFFLSHSLSLSSSLSLHLFLFFYQSLLYPRKRTLPLTPSSIIYRAAHLSLLHAY